MLMVGGAGLAYGNLFNDFNIYYPMLQKLITEKSWIKGIDLDIEESVSLQNVQMLINQIVKDFGEDFIITMAPIASSLINDGSSISGINYKELYQSKEGKYIQLFVMVIHPKKLLWEWNPDNLIIKITLTQHMKYIKLNMHIQKC